MRLQIWLVDTGQDAAASPDPSVTTEEGEQGSGALSQTPFYSRSHNTYEHEVLAVSPGTTVKQSLSL